MHASLFWKRSQPDPPNPHHTLDTKHTKHSAAKTLMVYLMETNANVYSWLVEFYKKNPIPKVSVCVVLMVVGWRRQPWVHEQLQLQLSHAPPCTLREHTGGETNSIDSRASSAGQAVVTY